MDESYTYALCAIVFKLERYVLKICCMHFVNIFQIFNLFSTLVFSLMNDDGHWPTRWVYFVSLKKKKKTVESICWTYSAQPNKYDRPNNQWGPRRSGSKCLGCTWAQYNVSACTAGRSTILTFLPGRGQLIWRGQRNRRWCVDMVHLPDRRHDEPINYACVL